MDSLLTAEAELYPTIDDAGRRVLEFMREHPAAPHYRNQSGNRLTHADLSQLRAFDAEVEKTSLGWSTQTLPQWLEGFVQRVFAEVPFYRDLGETPTQFNAIPPIGRAHLNQDIARFVPDTVSTEHLINFRTTGTTGNPLLLPSHPLVAARYLCFHKKALQRFGITITHGAGQVGVILVGYQQHCFTYVSLTPLTDNSGLAKINLHPNDWQNLEDREQYLDAMQAEFYTGDALSLSELLPLNLNHKPRAILSTGMMLSIGLQQQLEAKFSCPVIDFYSMNEAGPIGVFDSRYGGHLLLQPKLYVEILSPDGKPCVAGERGEITLTGGFNFCLPLLRYRTGDYARLSQTPGGPVLMDLQGRRVVRFRTATGAWINNIDITHALRPLPISQFALHQNADGEFILRLAGNAMGQAQSALAAITPLLGTHSITVTPIAGTEKVLQYTSDLSDASF